MDKFTQIYLNMNQIDEGLLSNIAKKVITKTVSKVASKAASKTTAKATSKVASKTIAKSLTSKLTKLASIISTYDLYKFVNKKNLVKVIVLHDFLKNNTEKFELAYNLVTDYAKGNYKEIPWQTVAMLGTIISYVFEPEKFNDDKSEELDLEYLEKTFNLCKPDLDKYADWKLKHQDIASDINKNDNIISEFCIQTQLKSQQLIFESMTEEDQIKEIKKVDPKTANEIINAINNNGNIKETITPNADALKLMTYKTLNINDIQNKGTVDKEHVNKILNSESTFMSTMDTIFSKETLISLIPFREKPTFEELGIFFIALKDYTIGKYTFDDTDFNALLGIGCDIGFTAVSAFIAGLTIPATFGLSAILLILNIAVTLGYVCDNMALLARNYQKRKANNTMILQTQEQLA